MEQHENANAQDLLLKLLSAQPNLLTKLNADAKDGAELAIFVDTFIRKYSDLTKASGPSRP